MRLSVSRTLSILTLVLFATCVSAVIAHAADDQRDEVKGIADMAIQPVMRKYNIPGMAVGITVGGKAYVLRATPRTTRRSE